MDAAARGRTLEETRRFWNGVADDWQVQVGDDGDRNRRLNSDPVLWSMAGEVRGLDVLDAGCGTGYLARHLRDRGARVIGVDFASRMVKLARAADPTMDIRLDSCTTLSTVPDAAVDLVISNYVLMDLPDLDAAVRSIHRVLRPGGRAVLVFSHPCFPQGRSSEDPDGGVRYHWPRSYFTRQQCVDPPWAHFTSTFIWFHRPLSEYWRAFTDADLQVSRFEEPRLEPARAHLAASSAEREKCSVRPYSVAFELTRPPGHGATRRIDRSVELHPLDPDDDAAMDALHRHACDPVARHAAAFAPADPPEATAHRARWRRLLTIPEVTARVIVVDGRVIGHVARFVREPEPGGLPEITIWIDRDHWGTGVGTTALRRFLHLLDERPIAAATAADNERSARLLRRCGFVETGRSRGVADARGESVEEILLLLE